jgi:predicted phage tail protein
MIRDVYLHGIAAREFGRHFRIDVSSPAEAVRALITLRPGLRTVIREGLWRVIVGPPRRRNAIGSELLLMNAGSQPIHFVPATRPRGGGDGKSIGMIIIGVVLIAAATIATGGLAAAFATPLALGMSYGSVIMLGASMVLGGIAALLTQQPTPDPATEKAAPDDQPSFLFNGVTNNSQQGGPVPLVFGTHLVGSVVVNAGLNAEDIAIDLPPQGNGDTGGGGGKLVERTQ